MKRAVFLDASYAIALASTRDLYHADARALADRMVLAGTLMVTTQAVLLEIGNALAKQRYRAASVMLLSALQSDPRVEIVALTETHYADAMRLYRERPDKEWGMTDCTSFVVMLERDLSEALTADDHFRQMGFQVLLGHGIKTL